MMFSVLSKPIPKTAKTIQALRVYSVTNCFFLFSRQANKMLFFFFLGGGGGGGGGGIKPLINEGKSPIFIHEILIIFQEKVKN